MDFHKIKLYYHTIRFLKPVQVYYRIIGRFKQKTRFSDINQKFNQSLILWTGGLKNLPSFDENSSFKFLNTLKKFKDGKIDWNYSSNGKLWTYNLNYFDFLNQDSMDVNQGIQLINQFIEFSPDHIDGVEPYPISLRSINWVKFLSKNKIINNKINAHLFRDCCFLYNNIEYHLLGNHLLENAFSLLFGAYYFQDEKFYTKSYDLLISELNEQVLKDGAHFELSPMYHKIILSRLLDSIQLIKLNIKWKKDDLLSFLEQKASLMISWLNNITYSNGNIPMVNDATYNIAPCSVQLFSYAKSLGIINKKIPLSDSGYRKIISDNYELFIDVGNVGPDYQLAHAHSDTFNFELIKEGDPIFVDTGISTYEKNNKRLEERSTQSHNTVKINSQNQTEVWGGFRVARRAKIINLIENNRSISASHDGYKQKGLIHNRVFEWSDYVITIRDSLNESSLNKAQAHFHFHSSITKPILKNDKVILSDRSISISFVGHSNIKLLSYDLSAGFNKTNKAFKLIVDFDKNLKTLVNLSNG